VVGVEASVVVVVVLVMDFCVTVGRMQDKLLPTCPSKKFYLVGTTSCCTVGRLECTVLF
jgi:hypothetical protein